LQVDFTGVENRTTQQMESGFLNFPLVLYEIRSRREETRLVKPNGHEGPHAATAVLRAISRLLDSGELVCFIDAVVPFARAADAYSRRIERRLGRRKVVIAVKECKIYPFPIKAMSLLQACIRVLGSRWPEASGGPG
jgi:hypothetical protein